MVTAALVKELRERTGAGMMDCKRALQETSGDIDKAVEYLREKGLASAEKKAGRIASEGRINSYIHAGGRIGVLIEINCETDFVAKTDEFEQLSKDLAMQVAASRPLYLTRMDVPEEVIAKEREILKAQALNEGKPEKIVAKMVEGRLEKYFSETCLMEQPFIKETEKTVEEVIREKIAKIGENIQVRRFCRFELGEGMEKKKENLAKEVEEMVGGRKEH